MALPFTYPSLLALLVIPLVLLIRVWRRPDQPVTLPFDHAEARGGWTLRVALNLAESLPPSVLVIAILVLAGPQQLGKPTTRRKLTNIEFCVDISGSMTARFGEGSRYDASMEAINSFLDFRTGDAFGLTFFGNSVLHWTPLTSDGSAIRCAPPYMRPENAPPGFGGTEIGKALLACQRRLIQQANAGDRMIVLVSDGFSADLSGGKADEISRQLKDNNISVYAVHISETSIPNEIVNIASYTGGEVFNPGDDTALKSVFERIDRMQPAELEKMAAESMDYFLPFCIVGLGLLGTGTVCLFGLRFVPW